MRCGMLGAGKKAPGGDPGVTLGTGAGARVGGVGIGSFRKTMVTLGDEAGVFKGVCTIRSKMAARCRISSIWLAPILANCVAGAGCSRAWVRSRAACTAVLLEDVFGTGHWCGKNWTVLAVRSAQVFGT